GDQREVVALVEHLAADLRVPLSQPPHLPVLLRDELLVQRRDLDVEIELLQVEVRGEALHDVALTVPADVEGRRLVLPVDLVEVQQPGELPLRGMREPDGVGLGEWCSQWLCAHGPPAAARRRPEPRFAFVRAFSTSSHTRSTAIAKTPCP